MLHELSAHVSVLSLDPATGILTQQQSIFALPDGASPNRNHHMGSADIHVDSKGGVVYVTNRTDATLVSFAVGAMGACSLRFTLFYQ